MSPTLTRRGDLHFTARENSGADQVELAWASTPKTSGLLAGYCAWNGESAPPKTLDYEELILVLSGHFGVRIENGDVVEAEAGDVIHIPKGTTVRYFGSEARVFFAITRPDSDDSGR
ncbi:cupin domain-containing protein [Dyella halodurans]|uniref:Cupin domain-containing protein n=1 Tax=Dyella halodurans TaxID=1920171 RepID=A0ABV9C019_9GAMM|nr:cupin domain-containing protein [Dyella halodurans]